MRNFIVSVTLSLFFTSVIAAQAQTVEDDFEGNGTIMTWFGDECSINTSLSNAYPIGINTSATVLEYLDDGGQYANVRFEIENSFDLSTDHTFSLKIYIPSNGLTGNQSNQISLKLQNGFLNAPWSTQCEIKKPIALDQWQIVTFDFSNDAYINLDPNSPQPTQRTDFNRVVIQINGENNNDQVLVYIDDVLYDGNFSINTDPEYDVLVWSDEFEGDSAINASNWYQQSQLPQGGSWYNGEIQHYTNRDDNSYVNNGILYIVGKKETFTDQGHTKQYTSARLNSKFAFLYGKVEVRAKLPTGVGTWPAIWTLGKNINEDGAYWDNSGFGTTSWPACGEMDIMEHWGDNQNYVSSATHTPSSFGGTINTGGQTLTDPSNSFHNYTLEWYPEKLVFSVDGLVHFIYEPTELNPETWPFELEQYILLNFAVLPNIDPNFTEDALEIDYVRVYQSGPISSVSATDNNQSIGLMNAPNPAHDYTTISYNLSEKTEVKLFIHDINGRLIQTLINGKQTAGHHQVEWNTGNLPRGLYFYTLKPGNVTITKKCIIDN
ncbi:MAG: beta-glucanase (GH16 family) [Halioglobus sp.]|jgi:beta-glucanase (GH16 family)